jgi:glycosyltransferase involved in cell wall biosynthesis
MKRTILLSYLLTTLFHPLFCATPPKLNILFLHYPTSYVAGIGVSLITCSKMLIEHGHVAHFLVIQNSRMESELNKCNIPYKAIAYNEYKDTHALSQHLRTMCKDLHINTIVCNWLDNGIKAAKLAAQSLPVKIVFIDHMHFSKTSLTSRTIQSLRNIDGAIGVSPDIERSLRSINEKNTLRIGTITYIPPFFDEEKFVTFTTNQTREAFFKDTFGLIIKPLPIICMIANMYNDQTKNHPLLLQAIKKLIHEKKKPLQLMLAGDGSQKQQLQQLCTELGIQDYVYFLGFTRQIPDLLYHSDFHVLSSQQEAFGIVHLEASLMKKPSIGATGTGATTTIQDGQTGLLFKKNDVNDLVEKIELLIDNKELRNKLGDNAYRIAQIQFSNREWYKKFEQFFLALIASDDNCAQS